MDKPTVSLDAYVRGMWPAEEKMKKQLQKIYLDIEGILEENQGEGKVR